MPGVGVHDVGVGVGVGNIGNFEFRLQVRKLLGGIPMTFDSVSKKNTDFVSIDDVDVDVNVVSIDVCVGVGVGVDNNATF